VFFMKIASGRKLCEVTHQTKADQNCRCTLEKKKKSVPGCRNWILLKASLEQMLILYFLHQFKKKKKKERKEKKSGCVPL